MVSLVPIEANLFISGVCLCCASLFGEKMDAFWFFFSLVFSLVF